MMRHWEDVAKSLQVEGLQMALGLPVSQGLMKEKEPKKEVAGWSTQKDG